MRAKNSIKFLLIDTSHWRSEASIIFLLYKLSQWFIDINLHCNLWQMHLKYFLFLLRLDVFSQTQWSSAKFTSQQILIKVINSTNSEKSQNLFSKQPLYVGMLPCSELELVQYSIKIILKHLFVMIVWWLNSNTVLNSKKIEASRLWKKVMH